MLLGGRLLDSTDSRPLDTSTTTQELGGRGQDAAGSSADEDFREYGVERGRRFPRDVQYSVELEYSQPLSWISRTRDGRFVLDDDSEEGGFTSPRRPIRGVGGRPASRDQSRIPAEWPREEVRGVESGVYHVRAGMAGRLHRRQPLPPRLSLRSDGSGASAHEEPRVGGPARGEPQMGPAGRHTMFQPHTSLHSPEFGRHVIPETPSDSAWSPRSRRFRASSPGPLSSEWSQLAQLASFSEVSSVQQPSSVERSFPSTVLSSFPNSAQDTPTALGISATLPPLRREELVPPHQYATRQLPPLSTSRLRPGQILVGAQVHSPPSRFHPQFPAWGTPSHPQLDPAWTTPRRPARMWPMARPVGHAARPSGRPVMTVLESGQHVHAPPLVREALGHIQPPRIPDIPRHYVNLPPRRDTDQRMLGRAPPCLLKPSSSENQKPLATSSPPRPRATQGQPGAQGLARPRPLPPPPPTSTKTSRAPEPMPRAPGRTRDSDSSSDQPVTYTRERLQEAIGRVRSGLFGEAPRTNSAPELRSAGRSESRHTMRHHPRPPYGGSAPESREQSHEQSQEQSPDSSSGFGSKNTSQQQSSSQSGQSLLALGLDSSRLEASEATETGEAPEPAAAAPPAWVLVGPRARPTPWMRPPNPPPYEEWAARQVLPQFRMPVLTRPQKPYMIPSVSERRQMLGSAGLDASVDSSSSVKVSPRPPPPITTPLPPQQPLDVSVDDHYEFDTVLSPTPGEDSAAEWSRTRVPSGERGLSDSEIYGSGGRRRHQSMEARVAAMKQEFNEYRKRQARRRRSREMESVC